MNERGWCGEEAVVAKQSGKGGEESEGRVVDIDRHVGVGLKL